MPSGFVLQIWRAWKAKVNQDKQPDRPSHVGGPAPREDKALWKTTTKIKVSFTEKKVLYFKDSFTFQSKSCILKKLLYQIESFIYLKESIIAKQKVAENLFL